MKVIVYEDQATGKAYIINIAPKFEPHLSEDQRVQLIIDKVVPNDVPNGKRKIAEKDDIPTDRTFRDAWKFNPSSTIRVDMPQARVIHMERIRVARDARLVEKDVSQLRALGRTDNASVAAIEVEKEVLRDIPQNVNLNAAGNQGALKNVWPTELGPKPF